MLFLFKIKNRYNNTPDFKDFIITTMNTQFKPSCAFCRANQKPFNHQLKNKQGQIVCRELLQHECPWCHIKGHTTKHCTMTYEEVSAKREAERYARWEASQQVRAAEQVRQEEIKANSWAGRITKKVSPDTIVKMEENEKIIAIENAAKLAKAAEEKRKSAEEFKKKMAETFVPRMRTKYGIQKEFVMPAINSRYYPFREAIPEKVIPLGEFWYFKIVGTKDDKFDVDGIANGMRYDNDEFYHAYLKEKYGRHWIYDTEGKEDDCDYIYQIRQEDERQREQADWEWDQQVRMAEQENNKRMEEEEKEEEEMKRKLQAGEISFKKFNKWRIDKLEERWAVEDEYSASGRRIVEAMERDWRADAEWLKRKEAREQSNDCEEESYHKRLKNDRRKARETAAAAK